MSMVQVGDVYEIEGLDDGVMYSITMQVLILLPLLLLLFPLNLLILPYRPTMPSAGTILAVHLSCVLTTQVP